LPGTEKTSSLCLMFFVI